MARRCSLVLRSDLMAGDYVTTDSRGRALGARILRVRRLAGLTQEQLGNLLSEPVSRAAVAHWEGGKHSPTADHLRELAETLKVSYEWLSLGRGEPFPTGKGPSGPRLNIEAYPVNVHDAIGTLKAFFDAHMTPQREAWMVMTDAIDSTEVKSGSYVIIDTSVTSSESGLIVLALDRGNPVIRIKFDKRLVAAPTRPKLFQVLTLDDVNVTIKGIVVAVHP